jgi:hypothetical protein
MRATSSCVQPNRLPSRIGCGRNGRAAIGRSLSFLPILALLVHLPVGAGLESPEHTRTASFPASVPYPPPERNRPEFCADRHV